MQVSACTVFPSTDLAKVPLRIITNSKLPQIRALGQILALEPRWFTQGANCDPIAHDWQVFTIWAENQQNCESTCCRLGAVELILKGLGKGMKRAKKNIIVFPSHKCHTRPCTLPYDQYGLIHCVYLVCILYIVDDILCIILCHVMAFICRHIYIVYTVPLSLCTCVQISALVWSSFLCFSQTPLSKTSQGPNRNPKRLILGLSYRPDSCEPFLPGKDDVPSSPAQDRTVVSWMCF